MENRMSTLLSSALRFIAHRLSFIVLSWLLCTSAFAQSDIETSLKTGLMRLMRMNSAVLPDLPMPRDGSGTSWLPDKSPTYAIHWGNTNWSWMLHGNLSARYTTQDAGSDGHRGASKFDGPNWIMLTANHPFSLRRQITLRGMWSLDPLTEGKSGYPLLFQTGESVDDRPLIDRQHPHDLFSELAVIYGHTLNTDAGYFVYLAYPGEPALGPPAFMHRPSARSILDAPIGHHWQDATHITFGVATLGFRFKACKLDGSVFTGREPNELRWDFDKPRFDSYSARISVNPTDRWAWQASGGYLRSPDALDPAVNLYRITASAVYAVPIRDFNNFSVSAIWGMNRIANPTAAPASENSQPQHSFLLESNLRLDPYDFFGRTEWIQKSALEIGLPQFPGEKFAVGVLSLGLDRDILRWKQMKLLIGAQGSAYSVPTSLKSVYGRAPFSVEVFLRVSPQSLLL
jgi:hypothetical protein